MLVYLHSALKYRLRPSRELEITSFTILTVFSTAPLKTKGAYPASTFCTLKRLHQVHGLKINVEGQTLSSQGITPEFETLSENNRMFLHSSVSTFRGYAIVCNFLLQRSNSVNKFGFLFLQALVF